MHMRASVKRVYRNLGFGGGSGPSGAALELSGVFPCSQTTSGNNQDTLGGIEMETEEMETDQDQLSNRQPRSRMPLCHGPGGTPPSLAKKLTVFGGNSNVENDVNEGEEGSMVLSPGGRVVSTGLFSQSLTASTPPLTPPGNQGRS